MIHLTSKAMWHGPGEETFSPFAFVVQMLATSHTVLVEVYTHVVKACIFVNFVRNIFEKSINDEWWVYYRLSGESEWWMHKMVMWPINE